MLEEAQPTGFTWVAQFTLLALVGVAGWIGLSVWQESRGKFSRQSEPQD